jgi:hypothetical protein
MELLSQRRPLASGWRVLASLLVVAGARLVDSVASRAAVSTAAGAAAQPVESTRSRPVILVAVLESPQWAAASD